jgi:transcriptional regulator with XRE-family HTH domain
MTEAKEARPLAEWRKARGLTQMRLAVKTDLTLGTIQSIESARRGVAMRTAQKIADALGVTILDIAWPSEEEIQAKRLGKIEPA